MKYPDRNVGEARLTAEIDAAFEVVRSDVDRGRAPSKQQLERSIADSIKREAALAYVAFWLLFMEDLGGTDGSLGLSEASRAADAFGSALGASTASALVGSLGDNPAEWPKYLTTSRAESIAITEITKGEVAGGSSAGREVDRVDLALTEYWVTRGDERVCPICSVLDGAPEQVWKSQYPAGPPAHPRCRCTIRFSPRP